MNNQATPHIRSRQHERYACYIVYTGDCTDMINKCPLYLKSILLSVSERANQPSRIRLLSNEYSCDGKISYNQTIYSNVNKYYRFRNNEKQLLRIFSKVFTSF